MHSLTRLCRGLTGEELTALNRVVERKLYDIGPRNACTIAALLVIGSVISDPA